MASKQLRRILASDDPRAAVRDEPEAINDMLLAVLSMNLQEAERAGATELADRLKIVWQAVTEVLEEPINKAAYEGVRHAPLRTENLVDINEFND